MTVCEDGTYVCSVCGFDLWIPIGDLSDSTACLYSDARFPGRVIVAFSRHFDAVEDMPGDCLNDFMANVRLAARAVRAATDCERVNIAILGNAVPHVHAHLIPRRSSTDVYPNKAPWEDPRERQSLAPSDEVWWVDKIRVALDELRRRAPVADSLSTGDTRRKSREHATGASAMADSAIVTLF